MDKGKARKMGMAKGKGIPGKKTHGISAELLRVAGSPVYWGCIVAGALLKVADCYSETHFGIAVDRNSGITGTAVYYLYMASDLYGLMNYAVVCLCALVSAALYAEDRQAGALNFRLQRMGMGRYALARTLQAGFGAFAAMAAVDLLAIWIMAALLGEPALVGALGTMVWGDSLPEWLGALLYAARMVAVHGLEAAFYSMLAMAVSVFLANRQVLAVLPFLMKYVGSCCYVEGLDALGLGWLYGLSPKWVYGDPRQLSGILGMPQVLSLMFTFLYTFLAGAVCGRVLYLAVCGVRVLPEREERPARGKAARGNGSTGRGRGKHRSAVGGSRKGSRGRCLQKVFGVLSIARYELYLMVFSSKFWAVLAMAVVFMRFFLGEVAVFASDYGLSVFPAGLAFYYSDPVYCNVGLLLFLFLVSDAPFRGNNQVYVLGRCGRAGLCTGQLLSLCAMSALFPLIQFLASTLMLLPHISLSGWGKVWGSIASGTASRLGYDIQADVSSSVILDYGPWQAAVSSLLLVISMSVLYCMVLYLLNRLGRGRLGTVVLGVWSVSWLFLGNMSGNAAVRKLFTYSAHRWLDLEYVRPAAVAGRAAGILLVSAVVAAVDVAVEKHIGDRRGIEG